MNHDATIKETFTKLIRHSHAHATLEQALLKLRKEKRGIVPEGLPYSIWQLLDHIRTTLWDIVEFCRSAEHVSPQWPDGYWSKSAVPSSDTEWDDCIAQIKFDTENFIQLINCEDADLYTPFSWGEGQTLLKEAIVIIDHNSCHIGQMILVRRLLGVWE